MDDLSQQLNNILSDPSSMAQIQSMMSGLGLGGQQSPQPTPAPVATPQANTSPLAGLGSSQGAGDMVAMMAKIAPFLGKVQQEDDSSRLLLALKPMLSEERRKKVDESMKILQMMRLLPLLKDTGVLSSLLGGLF